MVDALKRARDSKKPLDMKALSSYIAFDVICSSAYNYNLDATLTDPTSTEKSQGALLFESIQTLLVAQAASGLYAQSNSRQVSVHPEILTLT